MKTQKGTTMQAAAIDQFGGVDKIKVRNLPVPTIDADEVLIHVETAGVGVWDPFEREGGFAKEFGQKPNFPHVLGSDGAGTVEAVGKRVQGIKKGDRIYGVSFMSPKGGFYAEYVAIKANTTAQVPKQLTTQQAGVMAVDALTALQGLDTLHLKSGESIMIYGASGGVGHMAVQLAKRMGGRVLAVASGQDGVELAKRLGADAVVNGRDKNATEAIRRFSPDGLDAALVTAGGEHADKALEALADGGRVAYPNGVEPAPQVRPGIRIESYDGRYDRPMFEKLNRLINAGPFEVHIARTFSLDKAADAQRALDDHYLGKLALVPA